MCYVCLFDYRTVYVIAFIETLHIKSINNMVSLIPAQEATFIRISFSSCINQFREIRLISFSHYWYKNVFSSPGLSPSVFLCQFHPHHCLPPLFFFNQLYMVLVILLLLLPSCLYSQHNWMKYCRLDRIGTSIVSHQSSLQMTLLHQMTSSLHKDREEKAKGFGRRDKLSTFLSHWIDWNMDDRYSCWCVF